MVGRRYNDDYLLRTALGLNLRTADPLICITALNDFCDLLVSSNSGRLHAAFGEYGRSASVLIA